MARTIGLVLAGGVGSRMGVREPKALMRLEGRTLLSRAITTLSEICDEVTVAVSPLRPLPAIEFGGARPVFDPPGDEGPLVAMVAAFSAVTFDVAIVLAVDLPLVPSSSLEALAGMLEGERAALPAPFGRPQPLAAAYSFAAVDALVERVSAGDRAAIPAVLSLTPTLVPDVVLKTWPRGLDAWMNVNTPGDLLEVGRRLTAAPDGRAA